MLDRAFIRREPETVRAACARKGISAPVDEFLEVDTRWREVKRHLDEANAEMNRVSKSIGQLMAQGKREEAESARSQTRDLKANIQSLEDQERLLEAELRSVELRFPNLPHESVPDGSDASHNVVVREWGVKTNRFGDPVPHWEICEELGIVDFERAAKVAGTGFAVYKGAGAKLVRALVNFMLDSQVEENGYEETYPPFLVNAESLIGTGNLPKFEDDLYKTSDGLYLIPTGEVPVTNYHRDEILEGSSLPMKYAAYTACFRQEAGAAGRDTRGILRMHQFDKVELVHFTIPETSYYELEMLVEDAESILQALDLHYRVVLLCAGDLGDKGAKCYDLEVWSPGEGRYLEVSSCTNFEDYQARRANIRFRRQHGAKPEFVHILNGSGLAVPRLMVALLETNRMPDGRVEIPEPLVPYFGAEFIEKPE